MLLNAFVDFTLRDLDRASAAVWLLLFRDTKPDGLARTGQTDLARRAGVNVRTVRRACGELERRGLLTVVHRGGLRSGSSSPAGQAAVRGHGCPLVGGHFATVAEGMGALYPRRDQKEGPLTGGPLRQKERTDGHQTDDRSATDIVANRRSEGTGG